MSEKTFTQEEVNVIIAERLTRERTKYEAMLAEKDLELSKRDIDGKVSEALKLAGLNEKLIPIAVKYYDRAIVTRSEDGTITNMKDVVQSFHEEWKDFFGKIEQKPANVGNPPFQGTQNPDNAMRKAFGL